MWTRPLALASSTAALALASVAFWKVQTRPMARMLPLDRLDGSGDRALAFPLDLDASAAAVPGELPLQGFACTTSVTGKRPNGQLTVAFEPAGPGDVTVRIGFHGACSYAGTLHVVHGRLDDGALGLAYTYRCRRSPLTPFAVSCGPYLRSELQATVRGNGWGRTVHVTIPPSFHIDEAGCELPEVARDDEGDPTRFDELVFDLAECALTAPTGTRSDRPSPGR